MRSVCGFAIALAAVIILSIGHVTQARAQQPNTRIMTAAEVIELGMSHDGQRVVLEGEVVGETLRDDEEHRWANLLSGGLAIGVVLNEKDAASIGQYGRYGYNGTVLRVEGIYNAACDEHGGDRDVHAVTTMLISPGSVRDEPVGVGKLAIALALFLVAGLGTAASRFARRRDDAVTRGTR